MNTKPDETEKRGDSTPNSGRSHAELSLKDGRIALEISRDHVELLTASAVDSLMKEAASRYGQSLKDDAARSGFQIFRLAPAADELTRRMKDGFKRNGFARRASIPLFVAAPRLSQWMSVGPASSAEGIIISAQSPRLVEDLKLVTGDGFLNFFWFYAAVFDLCLKNESGPLSVPTPQDLLPAYMLIASGVTVEGLVVRRVRAANLASSSEGVVTESPGGWATFHARTSEGLFGSQFLKKLNAMRLSTGFRRESPAKGGDELKFFTKAQVATSHMVGLAMISDWDVISVCLIPPKRTARGVAGRFKLEDVLDGDHPDFFKPAWIQVEGGMSPRLFTLKTSLDRSSIEITDVDEDALRSLKASKKDGTITADDIAQDLRMQGILHGIDFKSAAMVRVVDWMNGKKPCHGIKIASVDGTRERIQALLRNDIDVLVSSGSIVKKGDVLARHKNSALTADVFGDLLFPIFSIQSDHGVALEDGAYVASSDGTVHVSKSSERISVYATLTIKGPVTGSVLMKTLGSITNPVRCSVHIEGDLSDVHGLYVLGSMRVTGSVNNTQMTIAGNLTVDKGITLGGKTIRVGGRVSSEFIQGYTIEPSRMKELLSTSGRVHAREIHTGFLIGCVSFSDTITATNLYADHHTLKGGAIINSQVYAREKITCMTTGGKLDGNNVILMAGVPLQDQSRAFKYQEREERLKRLVTEIDDQIRFLARKPYTSKSDQRAITSAKDLIGRYEAHIDVVRSFRKSAEKALKKNFNQEAAIAIRGEAKVGTQIKVGSSNVIHVTEQNKHAFRHHTMTSIGHSPQGERGSIHG
jgi:uncharacterized protein (DUF342 family)